MKKIALSACLLFVAALIESCSYGYNVIQNFTPLDTTVKTITCETPPQNVELVFESEKVTFDYEKIGVIEVQGEWTSKDSEILEKIKTLAKNNCCDAIISLKRDRSNRDAGMIFTSEYDHHYAAIIYHGIAVRKKPATQANETQNQQQ